MQEFENNSPIQTLDTDLKQLERGEAMSRHEWLQSILDNPEIGPNAYGQNPPRDVVLRAMLARIGELTQQPQRDMELEKATVALGRKFTSGPGFEGDSYVMEWVRATEVYEDLRSDWQIYNDTEPQVVHSDIVGIGGIYAGYVLGKQLKGLGEENDERWFMTFNAERICVHIPFDAITEVVDKSTQTYSYEFKGEVHNARFGAVIESPSDRSAMFHHWLQREAA